MPLTKRNSMFLNAELLSALFRTERKKEKKREKERERDGLSSDEII